MGRQPTLTETEEALRALARPVEIRQDQVRKDRLTATVTVNHELYGEQPTSAAHQFSALLEEGGEPYIRKLLIPTEWQRLDMQWVTNPGFIAIENRAGLGMAVNPSAEERERLTKQVILVGFGTEEAADDVPLVVRPGRFMAVELRPGVNVYLKAMERPTRISLFVSPR